MSNGLWVSPSKFVEFSAMPISGLLGEVAVAPPWWGLAGIMPDPDPILRRTGDDVRVLEDLSADAKVCSSIQGRKLKTLNLSDYKFQPGHIEGQDATPEAAKVCDDLIKDLGDINLQDLFSQILDTPYYGFTVTEHLWAADNGRYRLLGAVPKPREWFGFTPTGELRYRTPEMILPGWDVNPLKFTLIRHFPTYKNPYGFRLMSRTLWPVAFKRAGIEFLLKFVEKFGMPWVVGEARSGALPEERQEMARSLAGLVQDAVCVVSGGAKVNIAEAKTGGTGNSLHMEIINYMDSAIAQIIQGQTLTQDIGDTGSYAAARTHADLLNDFAAADQSMLVYAMNCLSRTYTKVNAGDQVMPPVFSYPQPEDLLARAKLGTMLFNLGVRFKENYFLKYGLAEGEYTVTDTPTDRPPQDVAATELAAPQGNRNIGQDKLEQLMAEALGEGGKAAQGMISQILDLVHAAETPDDLTLLMIEQFPDLDQGKFEAAMGAAATAADLLGRFAVKEEAGA